MKKIGRQVCLLPAGPGNPRNGEGAFIRLRDGGILYAYTEFTGSDWNDHSSANLCGIVSYDEGESWREKRRLVTADAGAANLMSVSLLRMENGEIGMFYLRKDRVTGGAAVCLRRSSDEGATWSEPLRCTEDEGYNVVNNDRVIRLQSGRLLLPVNRYRIIERFRTFGKGRMNFLASDDDGRTWSRLLGEDVPIPAEEKSSTGLQETGVYQYEDGGLWAWSRTGFGCQYECFSDDGGTSWTTPAPSEFFTSALSPMQVKRVGRYTVAVWNPIPNYTGRRDFPIWDRSWGRTPLVCAVSTDGGRTFGERFYIEDDPENGYCYPAILAGEDYFLLAYYHSNNSGVCLTGSKIVKVMLSELED